ncbi:accessory factor UbiK family protein [Aurantivibrio plasticivorans]
MVPITPVLKLLEQANKFLSEQDIAPEVKAQAKLAMQSALSRLDLVTREEFDAQTAVLQRTREKLDKLEQDVASLLSEQEDEK